MLKVDIKLEDLNDEQKEQLANWYLSEFIPAFKSLLLDRIVDAVSIFLIRYQAILKLNSQPPY